MYLVLKHCPTKGPNCCKNKIEFIDLFGCISGRVSWCKQSLKEIAESLDHADVSDGCDFFEADTQSFEANWNISIKEDRQICLFRLYCTSVNPALDKPEK